jgi:hypothetical protein
VPCRQLGFGIVYRQRPQFYIPPSLPVANIIFAFALPRFRFADMVVFSTVLVVLVFGLMYSQRD